MINIYIYIPQNRPQVCSRDPSMEIKCELDMDLITRGPHLHIGVNEAAC